ncbi:MAG: HAD hydrolase-like protein [Clostridiales bacterium]|nr:HAD hydrolase-like protein [Clostridiales bacterium]MDO5139967.1 HAD hydrolase-like protein [Eubacteriales bacterium]
MEKRYVLFDLDGTLTNSYRGIINALKYSLSKFTVEPKEETFNKIIGPPVVWSLQNYYGFDEENAVKGLRYFREYYDRTGYLENELYPGTEEMLKTLRGHDKKLLLATSKPQKMAEKVLEHFGLDDYFCFVAGANSDDESSSKELGLRATKEDVIGYVLKTNGILDPENAVMVGDRHWDIRAGKVFGLQTIGVSYGFADPGELEKAGADYIASNPLMVSEIVVQQ